MGHPALVQAYRLDGVITLVDAVNGEATLDAHVEAVKQVAVADRLVVTKTDLVADPDRLSPPARAAARHQPVGAAMLDVGEPEAGVASLFECGLYDPSTKTADVRRWLGEEEPGMRRPSWARHHHDHDQDHDHHRHDARVKTFSLVHDGPVPFSAIEMFLDLLRSAHGEQAAAHEGRHRTSRGPVAAAGHPWRADDPASAGRLPAWPDATRGTRLVLITLDMPEDYVRRMFAAITPTPAIDTPDRAAIEDNPLAIAGMG